MTTANSSKPARKYINQFGESEYITGVFSISNAQLGRTKNDKPYLKCMIRDKTGELPARMWTIDPDYFRTLPVEGFVYIEAETQPFQGQLQLILKTVQGVQINDEMLQELLPVTSKNIDTMFAELVALLKTLKHPAMVALAKVYLEDETLMTGLRRAPAAKSIHHAYIGGLLEHTLSLMKLADAVCPLYPRINRDLVLIGLFLHDLGKTRELEYDRTFTYSDRGELIGHIVDGAIMLHDKVQTLMRSEGVRLPPYAYTVLQHIIISHHGVPEFGAAKIPATPEAILVSVLDNLDAKTSMALAAARPERDDESNHGGNFTDRQFALDTKLFKPDPLAM
jgi:3'-5' exoribonuclease